MRGIHKYGCRCYERLNAKTGGSKRLTHSRWSGGRGYLRRGKMVGYERFESVRTEFPKVNIRIPIYVKVDT